MTWGVFEEVDPATRKRRVYIGVPPDGAADTTSRLILARSEDPRFLTSLGWADAAESLPVLSIRRNADAAYLEIGEDIADAVDEYQLVEVQLQDTEVTGVVAWPPRPLPEDTEQIAAVEPPPPPPQAPQPEAPLLEPPGVGEPEPPVPFWKRWWFLLLAAVLVLLIALLANKFWPRPVNPDFGGGDQGEDGGKSTTEEMNKQDEEKDKHEESTDDKVSDSAVTEDNPSPPLDDFGRFRQALDNRNYELARNLLKKLLAERDTRAAGAAAALAGSRPFEPGLFDRQDDRKAYQLYRLACQGGAGVRPSLDTWVASLHSAASTDSDAAALANLGETLAKSCKD